MSTRLRLSAGARNKIFRLSGCHTTAATENSRSVLAGMEPAAGVAKVTSRFEERFPV